ncbi:hypothetical protein J2X34_000911 [Rhodococcus sp. BE178]
MLVHLRFERRFEDICRQLVEQPVRANQLDTIGLGLRQQLLRQLLVIDLRLIHGIECFRHDFASPPSCAWRVGQIPDQPLIRQSRRGRRPDDDRSLRSGFVAQRRGSLASRVHCVLGRLLLPVKELRGDSSSYIEAFSAFGGSVVGLCDAHRGSGADLAPPYKRGSLAWLDRTRERWYANDVWMNRLGFDAASFLVKDADHAQALPGRAA